MRYTARLHDVGRIWCLGIGALSAFLLAAQPAQSNVLDYHPSSSLSIGLGYDPADPAAPHILPCYTYSSIVNIDTNGGSQGTFSLSEIKNRQELYHSLGISATLDAAYTFFSANGATNLSDETSFSSDSVTWIAQATIFFGRFQPQNPTAISALKQMTPEQLRATCGTQAVMQENRGVSISIVYSFDHLSSAERQQVQSAINASASFFSGDLSGSSSYASAIRSASEQSNLHITIVPRGGPGRELLAGVAAAGGDLGKVKSLLAAYLANSTEANAKPLSYVTGSLNQFVGYPAINEVATANNDNFLQQSLFEYDDLKNAVDRINAITIVPTAPDQEYLRIFVSDTTRHRLGAISKTYQQRMQQIVQSARSCLASGTCTLVDTTDLPRVDWPPFPAALSIVPTTACNFYHGEPIATITQKGALLGTTNYGFFIYGDKAIFDSVYKIQDGVKIPMQAAMLSNMPADARQIFTRGAVGGWTNCLRYNPDPTSAFAYFSDMQDLKWEGTPAPVEYHVADKYGRETVLKPTRPDFQCAYLTVWGGPRAPCIPPP